MLISVQFLTRLPIQVKGEVRPEELGAAAAAFPLAGLVIGSVLLVIYYFGQVVWPHEVAALVTLAGLAGITGGLHLDGLMDTADGIMSGKDRDKMLEIMKDSRVGAMGVIACFLVLTLKFLAVAMLEPADAYRVLVVFPVLSRCLMVWALACYPYARPGPGTGRPFADHVKAKQAVLATAITLCVAGGIGGLAGLALAAGAALIGMSTAWYLSRHLQGLTGDTYGAINEVVETTVLLLALALAQHGWLQWLL